MVDIGVIAGTGFTGYAKDKQEVKTDYGTVNIATVELGGKECLFAARHGRLQVPHLVNFRAIVQAFKDRGVKLAYCASASGRLGDDVVPGHLVVVDDFYNHDTPLPSFAEEGILLHHGIVPAASPTLRKNLIDAWDKVKDKVAEIYKGKPDLQVGFRENGTYVNIQGPGFSTIEEEHVFRTVLRNPQSVGMTLLREARLLMEMDIESAYVALCTDHSNYPGAPKVSHDIVVANMQYMGQAAVLLLEEAIANTDVKALDPAFHCLLPGLDAEKVNLAAVEKAGRTRLVEILMRENKRIREKGARLGF